MTNGFWNAGSLRLAAAAMLLAAPASASAQQAAPVAPEQIRVDEDGTVHVPPLAVPVSQYLSPEGKAFLAKHVRDFADKSKAFQDENGVPVWMKGYLASAKAQFAVDKADTTIAGVHAFVYTPRGRMLPENRSRVLINLHGGGFGGCWPGCAELESLPIAATAGMKVISLDYRQAPKYRFPAASEDVATVYRELLKSHRPQQIGIYGCSAGGLLIGMSMAWFQKVGLPNPGAVGLFCSGMSFGAVAFGGDANYVGATLGDVSLPASLPDPQGKGMPPSLQYLAEADLNDPLVAPARYPKILAKFPPTMIVTGTRSFDYSAAIFAHRQLVNAGVDAELNVWEAMFHGFIYNPDVPESQDFFRTTARFFDKHLAR